MADRKIITVLGARPQFVKAAVVSRAIAAFNQTGANKISEVIVHTGQHYDKNMSDIFFDEMQIPKPDYNLDINSGSHGVMTGRMLEKIEGVLIQEEPDMVLVYGDTNSTLAGALAAAKLHIPVAHVESGLRSFNMKMPEEVNRILTDRISDWLFCPTDVAMSNLDREGFPLNGQTGGQHLMNVGDVMYDAALLYQKTAKPSESLSSLLESIEHNFCLATVHRAENTDDPTRLRAIFGALTKIAGNTPVVIPIHPRTRKKLQEHSISTASLNCIDPVGYFDILTLLEQCAVVITDSGGMQKEAYFFSKPCVTLRDETEWVELVEQGSNLLAGADQERICLAVGQFLDSDVDCSAKLYGDGDAGMKIVCALAEFMA